MCALLKITDWKALFRCNNVIIKVILISNFGSKTKTILVSLLSEPFLKTLTVINYISVPMTAGFTSAAAITIASGQVKLNHKSAK